MAAALDAAAWFGSKGSSILVIGSCLVLECGLGSTVNILIVGSCIGGIVSDAALF